MEQSQAYEVYWKLNGDIGVNWEVAKDLQRQGDLRANYRLIVTKDGESDYVPKEVIETVADHGLDMQIKNDEGLRFVLDNQEQENITSTGQAEEMLLDGLGKWAQKIKSRSGGPKTEEPHATVREGYKNDDQGAGIARLGSELMKETETSPGDIIRISGEYQTLAKVWRASNEEKEEDILLDELLRRSAGVEPGDEVSLNKARVRGAQRVTVSSGFTWYTYGSKDEAGIKKSVTKQAVTKGDILYIRPPEDEPSPDFDFHVVVTETEPKGGVIITEETEFRLNR